MRGSALACASGLLLHRPLTPWTGVVSLPWTRLAPLEGFQLATDSLWQLAWMVTTTVSDQAPCRVSFRLPTSYLWALRNMTTSVAREVKILSPPSSLSAHFTRIIIPSLHKTPDHPHTHVTKDRTLGLENPADGFQWSQHRSSHLHR